MTLTSIPIRAAFDFVPKHGTAPLEVEFIDMSTGPVAGWAWDFGDGGASVAQSPRHIYTKPGVYYPSMIVTNSDNSDIAYPGVPVFVDPMFESRSASAPIVPIALMGVGLFAYVVYWIVTASRDTAR